MTAASIQRPISPTEVSDLVRTANDLRQSVVPFGGRLSLATGNVVPAVYIGLDLTGLTGIHNYHFADLTLSVASGTTFAEISDALGEHGQELPIDVPFPERSTIGGLIATGFAGPRRLGLGSLKDLIIGCEFVRGDGLLGHAGGMVVKNVSGFEIPRFLHGSWGSLAVLTSVNLKVLPKQRSESTLLFAVESVAAGLERAQILLDVHPALSACTVTSVRGDCSVAVRIMGRERAVQASIDTLIAGDDIPGRNADVLDPSASRAYWQLQTDEWARGSMEVVVAAGTRARDVATFVSGVENRFASGDRALEAIASPGTGTVRFRFDPAAVDAEQFWERLDLDTLPEQSVAYIESAPANWKGDMNVWRGDSASNPLMIAIKQQFDPHGTLNRGRLFV